MTASVATRESIWPAVGRLLRLRIQLSINSFRHSRLRAKILTSVGLLGLVALAGFLFFLSRLLLGFLRSPELGRYAGIDPQLLVQSMPQLILTGLFFGTLFTSFGVLLQALYLTGDMDFLLSSPVPVRAVFVAKLVQAVLPNFGLFALFGVPVLYGLGFSSGYNLAYYPLVLLLMVALALAAAALAALLVMAVVRVLPPRRAAEILGFVGATAGVICSQIGNLSQSLGRDAGLSPALVGGAFSVAMRLRTPWLPLSWAGQGLVDLGEGRWLPGAFLLAITLVLTSLVFGIALGTAERLYYSGWAGMQVVARRSRPSSAFTTATRGRAGLSWVERRLPSPVRAILTKDFVLLRRDLRNLSQLISPLIIGVVLAVSLVRSGGEPPPGRGEAPAWFMQSFRELLGFGNVAIALFVGWIMLNRLAGMSFSREGRNFWMLKAAPVTPRQMLGAKFLGAYLPTLGLSTLFLLGMSLFRRVQAEQLVFLALVVTFCLAGSCGILMAFGAMGANFTWDDPRRMNAGGLGCVGQIVTALALPIGLGLFLAPVLVVPVLQLPLPYGYVAGVLLGAGGNLVFALMPMRLVEGRVKRLNE